jgi:hypothetical protein
VIYALVFIAGMLAGGAVVAFYVDRTLVSWLDD